MGETVRTLFESRLILLLGVAVGLFAIGTLVEAGFVVHTADEGTRPILRTVRVDNVAELEKVFNTTDFTWPPAAGANVPRIAIYSLPDDLADRATQHKKTLFLRSLLPLILAENRLLRQQRGFLKGFFVRARYRPGSTAMVHAQRLADRYKVTGALSGAAVQARLLRRVDEIPPSLALAQAAIESGWGTSRFALEGNSLFGQWTWQQSAGITPANRSDGERHAVRAFPDLQASVQAYFVNLNTHGAYRRFRRLRAQMRTEGLPLNAEQLADGLSHYSQRGDEYVAEVKAMILANRLMHHLRDVRLADRDDQ